MKRSTQFYSVAYISSLVLSSLFVLTPAVNHLFGSSVAIAHEKSFPTKQLTALMPEGQSLTFKEVPSRPDSGRLSEFEKKYSVTFSKGELAGPLYLGSGEDKKPQVVAVFMDGRTDRGDTEFGASVTTQGRIGKVRIFSSSESGEATSNAFLDSLAGKNTDELVTLKNNSGGDKSKQFVTELALKALGRVSSSFGKK